MGKVVFCSNCLGDPGQSWGEELYLFRMASFGYGSPESIHSLLDQVGGRRELAIPYKGPREIANYRSNPVARSSREKYQYSMLGSNLDSIRVLSLHPATDDGQITCTLEEVAFSRQYSDFTAVSYTWGDDRAPKFDIYIDDGNRGLARFGVLQNLYQFLVHIQHPEKVQRLWIDAICINQAPDEEAILERKVQINLMGRIYRQASNVMIWLGLAAEAEEHSDFVFETIRQRDVFQMQSRKFWIGMTYILQRPWFQRTWIVQELALNKRAPQLLCGAQEISWTRFVAAFTFISSTQKLNSAEDQLDEVAIDYLAKAINISNLERLSSIRTQVQTDGGLIIERPMYRSLLRTRSFKATNASDRVYGLRGLMAEHLLPELPVDYKKATALVYQDAVQFMLKFEEGIQLFADFPLPLSLNRKTESWPSWIPDFNSNGTALRAINVDVDWFYRYSFRPYNFEISTRGDSHHPQGQKPVVKADFKGLTLIARGISVALIVNVVKSQVRQTIDRTTSSKLQRLVKESETVEAQLNSRNEPSDRLVQVVQRATEVVNSPDFETARYAYLSGLPLEERSQLRVRQIIKTVHLGRLTTEKLSQLTATMAEKHPDTIAETDAVLTSLTENNNFNQVKENIRSGPMSNEDKEACLSILPLSMEQFNAEESHIEALSDNELNALVEQVSILSNIPIVPGPDMMELREMLLYLMRQSMLKSAQQAVVFQEYGQLASRLEDAVTESQHQRNSIVQTLLDVDKVYRAQISSSDDTWFTQIWHSLLDGYSNLQDLSPLKFYQVFSDLVGNSNPITGSLGRNFEAPRSDQPLAKQLATAFRHVFHDETKFFTCKNTSLYGITTAAAQKGDILVFLFPTWYMPMVLRRVEGSDNYLMVGPAIIPSGRRIEMLKKFERFGQLGDERLQTFSII